MYISRWSVVGTGCLGGCDACRQDTSLQEILSKCQFGFASFASFEFIEFDPSSGSSHPGPLLPSTDVEGGGKKVRSIREAGGHQSNPASQ
ncbi:hypothetical protein LX36DRAFT_651854 [Colletotrichum falcatum]|nr:hypothetical protein LX36DRAFT_651854 [Colletotrichum falcatum]